jgi:Domain of unknown function (DUF4157)
MAKDTVQVRRAGEDAARNVSAAGAVAQCKLAIGAVHDPLEAEADAMADTVMRMPSFPFSPGRRAGLLVPTGASANEAVQRKCAHCEEEEEEEQVQMKPLASSITPFIQAKGGNGGTASDSVTNKINTTRGGGSPMDRPTQSFMESRFGTDFSNVKIHTGNDAVQMNRELNAQAFTVGSDIYFNSGKYNPSSESGRHLLAHELTHTVQQSGGIGRKIQRTVDNVEINCADSEIRFFHDGITTAYHLDTCVLTDNTYDAGVKLSPGRVDFDLGVVPPGTKFDFTYSIGPGQPSPNTFFKGQSRVKINCSNTSSLLANPGDIRFNVKQLTDAEFEAMTGNSVNTIPEGMMVPLSNFLGRSLPSAVGPATAGAAYFSPTPWSFIPKDVTGVMWTQGHTSIFSNPSGALSPTIKGYRGNLGYYAGESLPWIGRQCTIRLHEGVPGSFANDAWFPMMPGDKSFIFMPRTNEQAIDFAGRLAEKQYGGDYTYSPPRSAADPVLGEVRPTEGKLNADLIARGKAPMCTNNCITVPQAEITAAMGGRPVTPGGIDVMTGTRADGTVDPHYAGRGRLMTDAMNQGPVPPGASRMNITVTPGGSAGMFIFRGAGKVMLVYGIYHTTDRIVNTPSSDLPVVISEEAGSWGGGIFGAALGGAAAGAVFCAPTGPVDAVCVVGGFLGGLIFGIAGSSVGQAIGHTVGEYVVDPVVDTVDEYIVEPVVKKAAEVESSWTRGIYNLYGVPYF